jgi:hypothetical protein
MIQQIEIAGPTIFVSITGMIAAFDNGADVARFIEIARLDPSQKAIDELEALWRTRGRALRPVNAARGCAKPVESYMGGRPADLSLSGLTTRRETTPQDVKDHVLARMSGSDVARRADPLEGWPESLTMTSPDGEATTIKLCEREWQVGFRKPKRWEDR